MLLLCVNMMILLLVKKNFYQDFNYFLKKNFSQKQVDGEKIVKLKAITPIS